MLKQLIDFLASTFFLVGAGVAYCIVCPPGSF